MWCVKPLNKDLVLTVRLFSWFAAVGYLALKFTKMKTIWAILQITTQEGTVLTRSKVMAHYRVSNNLSH